MPRGGFREGAGRKPEDPQAGALDKRVTIWLSGKDYEHCEKRGKGKVSEYIRHLVAADTGFHGGGGQ
jgi:hypothetical protein